MKIPKTVFSSTLLALILALVVASLGLASDVDVAVVDVTDPTGSVTLAPGASTPIVINMTVTGRQEGTATFEVYRDWTLSGGVFSGSNPQEFTVPPRNPGDPATTFSTSGSVTVAAGQAAGTFTLAVGAFDITNTNTTGAKLAAGSSSSYQVTVAAPADTTRPVITPIVSGTLGNNGWYVSDVTVSWSVVDNESAVTSSTGCGSTTISSDTLGVTLTCTATSAGGTASNSVTIKRDATVPTIAAALAPLLPDGDNGWYVSAPTVSFTCTDALSGVVACPANYPFGEGADQSHSRTVYDNAGNSASAGVSGVDVDLTAPSITAVLAPLLPDGDNGWYVSEPTVSFTCTDALSGVVACPADYPFGEGADQFHSRTVYDNAGNSASAGVSNVDVDLTAPSIAAVLAPLLPDGDNGWYVSEPTVSFTCTDALSGVAACPADYPFGEGADQSHSGTVYDNAGNSASAGVSNVDVDLTVPTIAAALDPLSPDGDNGWYVSKPTVSFTCSDALSGVVACPADYTFGEGADQSHSRTVYDNAGNSASAEVFNVDVDLTAPSITATLDPLSPDGANGWYVSKPTVSFTCSDALSGVVACPADHMFDEGADQSHSRTVFDNAGNRASAGVSNVDVDLTAPSITATLAPLSPDGDNGWYVSKPTVSFTCWDALSGVVACPDDYTFGEGADQSHSETVYDNAGNSASAGVSNVDVDLTAPSITWSNGPVGGGVYYFGFVPPAPTCTATDATSGVDAAGCTVSGYGSAIGVHTLTATAKDNAGNTRVENRAYSVWAWRLSGFYHPVDMGGVMNTVKSGATVPLKFEVFAAEELTNVSVVQSLTLTRIACRTRVEDRIEELAPTGGTVLRYSWEQGQFIYNWKTPRFPNTCYRVTLTTRDGSSLVALFNLK